MIAGRDKPRLRVCFELGCGNLSPLSDSVLVVLASGVQTDASGSVARPFRLALGLVDPVSSFIVLFLLDVFVPAVYPDRCSGG